MKSIEVTKLANMAATINHDNDAQSDRQIVSRLKRPPAMYKPEMTNNSGSFMARSSIGEGDKNMRDSMTRIGGTSALSINFPTNANGGREIPLTTAGAAGKLKQ